MAIRWSKSLWAGLLLDETMCGQKVGAGLLAKAVYQSPDAWLTHCIREQARSHIGFVVFLTMIELQ